MTQRYRIQRQHPRYNVDIHVSVAVAKAKFEAHTRDVSRAGLCLVAKQPIARDTDINLELVLTFGDDGMSEPLVVQGRVAWCTALFGAFQIGVKFINVDDDRARYLDMFVGFLDGTLAPGPVGPDDEETTRRAGDPDRPHYWR
jgi:hypothetical protein